MKIIHEKLYLQLSNLFFMINKLFIITTIFIILLM